MEGQQHHLEKLWQTYQKRLDVLEIQAAKFGISAPPHILMEIEEIRDKIKSIETQLTEIKQPVPQAPEQQTDSITISILFLTADPTNASRLRLGEELREIQEKLQLAQLRDRFALHQRMSVRPADISQALLDVQPQIVHFSGHGTSTGALCFENQVGELYPIQPEALTALFEVFVNQVNCVLLNACYSEIQAEAIAKHIDYVIGMNQAIGDEAAIAFAIGFYQALGAGRTMEEAHKLGCVQIRLQGIPEHLTPVLVKKEMLQPDHESAPLDSVGQLKKGLYASSPGEREEAARSLGKLGAKASPAVAALVKALKDPSGPVRTAAALALLEIGTPEALSAVERYEQS